MTFKHPWRGRLATNPADEHRLRDYFAKHLCANLDELVAVFDTSPEIIQRRLTYLEQQGTVTYSPSTKTWHLKRGGNDGC
jgi:hypothetical protein